MMPLHRRWIFLLLTVALVVTAVRGETLILEDAFAPSWSPDGSALACDRPTPTYGDEDIQIWWVSGNGDDPHQIIDDPNGAFFPKWLPDGQRIVYLRFVEGVFQFVVHDLQNGADVIWPAQGVWDDYGIHLTPDGSEILYTVYTAPPHETWALDLDTGATRFVISGAGGCISPDNQWIVFNGDNDILSIMPFGGGPVLPLELGVLPSWTPDSRYIIFSGMGSSAPDIILRSRDGMIRMQLTDDPETDWNGGVSPDGDRLAYYKCALGDTPPFDLWILDLDIPSPTHRLSWGRLKMAFH